MPSTVIKYIEYEPERLAMRVTFVSGVVYEYKDVPPDEYEALRTSKVKGIYLNRNIKGKYKFEKLAN